MSTPEILQQKLDIAKRAGELHGELAKLFQLKKNVERKKNCREGLRVITANQEALESRSFDKYGTTLHDLVIGWIEAQIAQREAEVNDLIKILS